MVNLTSKEVANRIDRMSVVGFVLDLLQKDVVLQNPEHYQEIKEIFHAIPQDVPITREECKEYLRKIIHYEECIVVSFKKKKDNGKFGHRKEYKQGFFYYIGNCKKSLEKIYLHWGEEKVFLLNNIDSLRVDVIQVKKLLAEYLSYVCVLNLTLMNNSCLLGDIAIYIGYSGHLTKKDK